MPETSDNDKLKIAVNNLWISSQHFTSIEATAVEIEIRQKLEGFQNWANKLIDEKLLNN